MARKKKPDEPSENGVPVNGIAVADPPEALPTESHQGARDAQAGEPAAKPTPPNRPAASFAAHSDRTTRIEVAVWSKLVKVSEQEEYTQYALTLSRSWCDRDGHWQGNASFRIHDLPVLLYLVQQAHHWCVAQRTTVKIGDEPLPF
jgi:hypothetical protein